MIRIDMIRQDTRHPDKRRRHQGRAICEVAGQRFEAQGPAPVYKLATLLWLHGHGGVKFEVYDDLSPFGRPGGRAMRGTVRNWARLVNGKPKFDRKAPPDPDFKPSERGVIAQAAGGRAGKPQSVPPRGDNARTAATRPSDGLRHHQGQDDGSTRFSTARAPEAV